MDSAVRVPISKSNALWIECNETQSPAPHRRYPAANIMNVTATLTFGTEVVPMPEGRERAALVQGHVQEFLSEARRARFAKKGSSTPSTERSWSEHWSDAAPQIRLCVSSKNYRVGPDGRLTLRGPIPFRPPKNAKKCGVVQLFTSMKVLYNNHVSKIDLPYDD